MAEVLAAHGRELAQLAEEQHAFWMESIRLAFAHMSAELQLEEGRLLVPEARVLSKDSINQFLKEKLNAERREKALAEKALERPLGQQFPSRQPAIPDACSVPEQALSPPVSQTVSMGRPADRDFQATICAIPETRQISTNILSPQISEATAVRPDKGRQWFDTGAAVLVLANCLAMILELEVNGRQDHLWDESVEPLPGAVDAFLALNYFFDVAFFLELLLRLALEWRDQGAVLPFLHSPANGFDAFLAICGLLDVAVRSVEKGQGLAVYVVNATNSMRYLRLLRFLRLCGGLRLLMKACQSFLQSLLWSMLLLTTFLVASALFIGNLLQSFIEDRSQVLEDRLWVWEHFGTAYRSCYSLFEITFAGNWPVIARPVMNKVSHGFVAFFVLYITVIAFALIRIITAVFLKDTLDMAANDAELLMSEKMKKKAQYASKLEQVFLTIDSTGEGIITERRLAEVLEDPTMKTYFQTLDLDVHESNALFHLLDDGDGTVTLDEFIDGVMRCKGPARAIDQVAMHAEIKQLDRKLSRLLHGQGAPGSGIASAASGPRGRGFSDPEMAPSNQSSRYQSPRVSTSRQSWAVLDWRSPSKRGAS